MDTTPSNTRTDAHNGEGGTDLLTTAQAATYLGLAPSTLNKWRVYSKGPAYIKLERAVRYRINDLDAYTASHTYLSTRTNEE